MQRQGFLRKHGLWVGFVVVLVPLLVILGLQYRSLVALEKTSVAAHRGALRNYLEAVAADVANFYRTTAARTLPLLADAVVQHTPPAVDACITGVQGAQLLFTAFMQDDMLQGHFYDPMCQPLASAPDAATVYAIKVAAAPWIMLSKKGMVVEAATVTVELMARVEAVLRRTSRHRDPLTQAQLGDVTVNFRTCEATKDGVPLDLSPREFQMLHYLIAHRGEVVSREQLLDAVWGYDATPFTRTVDMHIAKLRKKIEDSPMDPSYIMTVHRVGYKFVG